jgi:hypothetical protein
MGLWNTHGMVEDEEAIQEAIATLGLSALEMEALVEYHRREQWVWERVARHTKGQEKRKSNLIATHFRLRMNKWIELTAAAEVEHEEDFGEFRVQQGSD